MPTACYQRAVVLCAVCRETSLGPSFFSSVAKPNTVKNILCQAYHNDAAVTDELVQAILQPGLQVRVHTCVAVQPHVTVVCVCALVSVCRLVCHTNSVCVCMCDVKCVTAAQACYAALVAHIMGVLVWRGYLHMLVGHALQDIGCKERHTYGSGICHYTCSTTTQHLHPSCEPHSRACWLCDVPDSVLLHKRMHNVLHRSNSDSTSHIRHLLCVLLAACCWLACAPPTHPPHLLCTASLVLLMCFWTSFRSAVGHYLSSCWSRWASRQRLSTPGNRFLGLAAAAVAFHTLYLLPPGYQHDHLDYQGMPLFQAMERHCSFRTFKLSACLCINTWSPLHAPPSWRQLVQGTALQRAKQGA